jgi:hypothetical protein
MHPSHIGLAVRCPQPVRHPPIGGFRPGPISAFHRWARFELGLPLTAAAAVLWAVASLRLGGDPSTRWRVPVFAAHTALAAALVWIDPAFGRCHRL